MMCRREHITHYENLANLDQVVNTRFTFAGFPLKLQRRPRRPDPRGRDRGLRAWSAVRPRASG